MSNNLNNISEALDRIHRESPPQTHEQGVWVAGVKAFEKGEPTESNPYAAGTQDFISWSNGWYDAQALLGTHKKLG